MHRLFRSMEEENNETTHKRPKRSYTRHKSSSHVVPTVPINPDRKQSTRTVRIRVVFIHIGEIDTLNERYQADIYYEARWTETIHQSKLTTEEQTQLINTNAVLKLENLDSRIYWNPQLFIENSIGQVSEQDRWFTVKRNLECNKQGYSPSFINLTICEHRRFRGMFWEKLELNHFPVDVQDLTVSLTTHHCSEQCELLPDENFRSSINREAFFDQQEWSLYKHVAAGMRETQEEYSFRGETNENQSPNHPVLAFTCRAARRPGYYYWNGFCLIFMITICAFCIFSITPDLPQNRLQITCTLLLTSVTFRWVVNRSLPTISYLTTLDQYAIISIVILVVLCIWHSIIAVIIFVNKDLTSSQSILPTNKYVIVDRYMFVGLFVFYILIHIALFIWLIFVPYRRRREMEYYDRQYAAKKLIIVEPIRTRYVSIQTQPTDVIYRRGSNQHGHHLPTLKSPMRSLKHNDGMVVQSNAMIFSPIKEEGDEISYRTMTSTEAHEQDDVFYDHTPTIKNGQTTVSSHT